MDFKCDELILGKTDADSRALTHDHHQADLFDSPDSPDRKLMAVIDAINHSGLGHIDFASKGVDASEWMMKREHLSPRYTTWWDELPIAR